MKLNLLATLLMTVPVTFSSAQELETVVITTGPSTSTPAPFQVQRMGPRVTWEIGLPLITRNNSLFYNSYSDFPNTEFINGLFIRASKKRFAFRFHIKYNEYESESPECPTCNDYLYINQYSKLFHTELGAQFNLLRNNSLLYVYTDVYYQNIFASGVESGGFAGVNNSYSTSTNGVGVHTGLGSKIRVVKSVYVSPELGYNVSRLYCNRYSTNLWNGTSNRTNYINMFGNMYGRVVLSVQF